MVLITNVIYDYLADNRRVTVPNLGTFMAKESRDVVLFSEFMKGDDGVLCGLLVERGVSSAEGEAAIAQFVADVRSKCGSGECYDLSPMGYLSLKDGALTLDSAEPEPEAVPEPEPAAAPEPMPTAAPEQTVDTEEQERVIESILDSFSSYQPNEDRQEVEQSERLSGTNTEPKPRYDVWLVGALIVGVIALFALLYGFFVEWQVGNISFGSAIDGFLESIF